MPRHILALLAALVCGPAAADDAPLPPGAAARFGDPTHQLGYDLYYTDLSPDGKSLPGLSNGYLAHRNVLTGKSTTTANRLLGTGGRLAYMPDGKRFIVYGTSEVLVWDPGTETPLVTIRPLKPVSSTQGYARVAGSADGKRIALCRGRYGDQLVYAVWDVDADKAVSEVTGPALDVTALALSPDGKLLATWGRFEKADPAPVPPKDGDPARTITFWDADTGKAVHRMNFAKPVAGRRVCFAPDGKSVLVAGADIELWDTAGWKRLWSARGRPGYWPDGNGVAFSPDGKRFAILDADGTTVVRDAVTGGNPTVVPGHAPGHTIRFVANDRAVVLGGVEFAYVAWEVPSGKPLTPVGHHLDAVRFVRFTPDGKQLLSVSEDGELIRWDVATGRPVPGGGLRPGDYAGWVGPDDLLEWVSADGTRGVFGRKWNLGKDSPRPARVCDMSGRKELFSVSRKADMLWSSNINCSPGGTRLLLNPGCRYGYPADVRQTTVWDMATGKSVFVFPQHDTKPNNTYFSPDDRLVLLLEGNTARVWDVTTGKETSHFRLDVETTEQTAGISPDGRTLAVMRDLRPGAVFDLATGRLRLEPATPQSRPCSPLVFSPDGRLFAVGQGSDGKEEGVVQVWEVASGTVRHTFAGHPKRVPVVAFSPDGRLLASGSHDCTILLWDLGHAADTAGVRGAKAERLWEWLAEPDAAKAHPALRELVGRPADAVPLIARSLDATRLVPPTAETVKALIGKLGADDFAEREAAEAELTRYGRDVFAAVTDAAVSHPSAEARRRLAAVAQRLKAAGVNRNWLRAVRAVEVLERVGTPEARRTLRQYADGDPGHPLREEAGAALRRLGVK